MRTLIALALVLVWLAPLPLAAQDIPRTPWGDPDFRGHWVAGTSAPMENPIQDAWQLTEEEFRRYPTAQFFPDHQAAPGMQRQERPMIIDPPDGRIPLQDWAIEKRVEIMANQDKLEHLDPRVKCLPAAVPRGNLPVGYNSYQFLQVPGAVILLYEWNHHTRYIPLDGSDHVAAPIQLGMGDSRGRWEGDTLVVDVTNFSPKTDYQGSRENLHLVERWRRVDAETLEYVVTMNDPTTWTAPWTVALELSRQSDQLNRIYKEPRCHEGNYGMPALLRGARAEEQEFADGTGPDPATLCSAGCGGFAAGFADSGDEVNPLQR